MEPARFGRKKAQNTRKKETKKSLKYTTPQTSANIKLGTSSFAYELANTALMMFNF